VTEAAKREDNALPAPVLFSTAALGDCASDEYGNTQSTSDTKNGLCFMMKLLISHGASM
jgi:hypothetical protein